MPQRNNPMSAVQKKRTVSTTKKKGTTSSSKLPVPQKGTDEASNCDACLDS